MNPFLFVSGEKRCPQCGGILRFDDVRGPFRAGRYLGVELLFWAAVALFIAALVSSTHPVWYASLGAASAVAWLFLRAAQRRAGRGLLSRRQYYCGQCRRKVNPGSAG